MRSITKIELQYAHRFYKFQGEAQYLHGHTGVLTIEVEDTVDPGVNMVFPCNEIQKVAWDVLKNFDHALVLREDDPLLPAILDVYDKQGIRNGSPNNKMKGAAFKTELATAYPDCRRRHDQDRLRPAERQAQHRQADLHQRSQRRHAGVRSGQNRRPLSAVRRRAGQRSLPEVRLPETLTGSLPL